MEQTRPTRPADRKHIKRLKPVFVVIIAFAPEPRGLPVSMVSWAVETSLAFWRVAEELPQKTARTMLGVP